MVTFRALPLPSSSMIGSVDLSCYIKLRVDSPNLIRLHDITQFLDEMCMQCVCVSDCLSQMTSTTQLIDRVFVCVAEKRHTVSHIIRVYLEN